MSDVTYEIVEHDGGWAYKVDGVFSETFPTHAAALKAAQIAAAEQQTPGNTEEIEFEDFEGQVAYGNRARQRSSCHSCQGRRRLSA